MRALAQETETSDLDEIPVEPVDVSWGALTDKLDGWLDGVIRLLPNFGVALVILLIFWGLGAAAKVGVQRWANRRERSNLGEVLGKFTKVAIIIGGALLALTVVLPTLNPADLVAGLGIGSVAIGFAFKDILQNWLAGLLILLGHPFRVGDQIRVDDYEGTVEHIETRFTAVRTYDGRLVLVPNSHVYTNVVTVNTASIKRRSEYDVGIGYGDDIALARSIVQEALENTEGVERDPAPEVLVVGLAAYSVTLRPRWWTDSRRSSVIHVQSRVIATVKTKLGEAGIDLPYETQVHLFHDQTDEYDGWRGKQREGWPPVNDANPRPARVLQAEREEKREEKDRKAAQ